MCTVSVCVSVCDIVWCVARQSHRGAILLLVGTMTLNNTPQQVSVFLNSLPENAVRRNLLGLRGVTVMPLLSTQPPNLQQTTQKVGKVLLKAVEKHDKKKSKTRYISVPKVGTY